MKMLMVVVDGGKKEELEVALGRCGVPGWTELSATGSGERGPRLNSAAFPATSAVVLSLLPDAEATRVAGEIRGFCATCGDRAKIVTWTVEES